MRSPRKDARYRRAKAEGYRARSAYKLIDLDDRYRLLGESRRVVDLGAWPGGWLQVATERCPREAILVGVDVEEIAPIADPRVRLIVGDVTDPDTVASVRRALGGPADLVLSDAAPNLTGIASSDHARLEALGLAVIDAATALLRPGGTLVMKIFSGASGDHVRRAVASRFRTVKATRPEASRRGSSEMYVIARGCG